MRRGCRHPAPDLPDEPARDLRNREIAETLFLTEKTVEMHLTTVYRKLGIRSRVQLAGAGVTSSEHDTSVPA